MTTPGEGTRELVPMSILNTEVQTELKERLMAYARREGISQAAATRVLLNGALTQEGFPRR